MACVHNSIIFDISEGSKSFISKKFFNGSISMKKIIKWKNVFHTSSLVYRKSALQNDWVKNNIINGVGDFPLALYLRAQGKIYYLANKMSVYRRNVEGSWSNRNRDYDVNAKMNIKILENFNDLTNNKYFSEISQKINRLNAEIMYRNLEIKELREMGYSTLIRIGCGDIAISVFLQVHVYKLYRIIKENMRR